jgi:NTP pyrophosphatase (non-canonical NTP hydrolase)
LFEEIQKKAIEFRDARDWAQFHTPRTLAASIAIEAGELLEIFQWTPDADLSDKARAELERVKEELADVLIYAITMAHDLGIDLEAAVLEKLERNGLKYPVEKAKGSSAKYCE